MASRALVEEIRQAFGGAWAGTVRQVADYLGIHPDTVRAMCARGLPYSQLGMKANAPWRIRASALAAWLEVEEERHRLKVEIKR